MTNLKYIVRILFVILGCIPSLVWGTENLDRGLVAIAKPGGNVYVGWRLLKEDPEGLGFDVYKKRPTSGTWQKITDSGVTHSTNYVDDDHVHEDGMLYRISWTEGQKVMHSKAVEVFRASDTETYLTIPLEGDFTFQKCAIADLNGDGAYDFVIKQPDVNIDPQQKGWRPSTTTYKLQAYSSEGHLLWKHDMGWSIETGIWYSPYLAYDLDGDGRAEVYTKYIEGDQRDADGHVRSNEEFVARLDGLTGAVTGKAPWPSREGYVTNTDNHSNRNLMAVAYLDGVHPSLIVHRGIYDLIKSIAYDDVLNKLWHWDSGMEEKKYWHAGTHGLFPADIDDDGRDEIVYGSAVLDEYGKGLWTLEMGHCDFSYVGDILPSHPGYEIFYGFETWQDRNGIGLADAATGRFIWGYDAFVKHVHSQGMCADILADHPGMELYGSQKNGEKTWLYDAQGNLLHEQRIGGLAPRAVRWDADEQQELILNNRIMAEGIREDGHVLARIEGEIVAIADILGDWREEVITAVEGELRIYTTTVPADNRRVCLMQDRLYRNYVATVSMGYFYPPIPGGE